MNPFLLLVLAYLLGATPTGLWVGKRFHGIDLRQVGSGNLGATNTFRVLGWKAALPVMLVDLLKGWFPTWFFPRIDLEGTPWAWTLAYGAAAILGHCYSVWVRFRGGKGVATSGGVFLALAPWAMLAAAAVWGVTVAASRIVSLGSVLAALVLPLAVALTPHEGGALLTVFSAALALFVIGAHRSNLGRLLRGEEHRFGRGGPRAGTEDPRGGESG